MPRFLLLPLLALACVPPDPAETDMDEPPVGTTVPECSGLVATHRVYITGRNSAAAFCDDYVGTVDRLVIQADVGDALSCLCVAGELDATVEEGTVELPALVRVGLLEVDQAGTTGQLSVPRLAEVASLTLEGGVATGCDTPSLDAPLLAGVTTLNLIDEACPFDGIPALTEVEELSMELHRAAPTRTVPGPSYQTLTLSQNGADLSDAVPCVESVHTVHIASQSTPDVALPTCLRSVSHLKLERLGTAGGLIGQDVVIEKRLTARGVSLGTPAVGVSLGPELAHYSVLEATNLVLPSTAPTIMESVTVDDPDHARAFDTVREIGGLSLVYMEPSVDPLLPALVRARHVDVFGGNPGPLLPALVQADFLTLEETERENVDGDLGALREVDSLRITGNLRLRSLEGLHGLERVGVLTITRNPLLSSDDIDALVEAIGDVREVVTETGSDG